VKQAIRDLQGMLMFDVHRIFSLAKALVKANHLHNNINAQLGVIVGQPVAEGLLELKQINCLGDLYVRERHWEESLEVRYMKDSAVNPPTKEPVFCRLIELSCIPAVVVLVPLFRTL
jgi:hypothetical protein